MFEGSSTSKTEKYHNLPNVYVISEVLAIEIT